MQEIITILIMAMNLLTAVQSNPNLPVEFKTVAISVANNAIAYANQEIAKQPAISIPLVATTTISTAQPVQEQPVGGIIIPMEQPELFVRLINKTEKDPINNLPFREYTFEAKVKYPSGKHLKQEIVMDAPDHFDTSESNVRRIPNAITSKQLNDWWTGFSYIPLSAGEKTLTFTSGNLTKQITVNVD